MATTREIRFGDDRMFAVVRDGGHPPLVWLHGGFGTCESATALLDGLPPDHGVIAPDVRCHGRSVCRDPARVSREHVMSDVVALLDHLELDRAVIGGASLGCAISAYFAVTRPERVAGLVLARIPKVHHRDFNIAPQRVPDLDGTDDELRSRAVESLVEGYGGPDEASRTALRGWASAAMEAHDPRSMLIFLGTHVSPPLTRERISRIGVPTLIVASEQGDAMHPREAADDCLRLIAGATPADVDADVPLEAAIVPALRDFLAGVAKHPRAVESAGE